MIFHVVLAHQIDLPNYESFRIGSTAQKTNPWIFRAVEPNMVEIDHSMIEFVREFSDSGLERLKLGSSKLVVTFNWILY